MKTHNEQSFESVIESHLLANGFVAVSRDDYDRERAIFPKQALEFIQATQKKEWAKLETLHKDTTGAIVLQDLCKMLDALGCLTVLRHGFKCYGQQLYVAFFAAAHELNPELNERFRANRLGVTRQLHYSARNENSLDLCLSLNGIPVITSELKNPMTGQTVNNAIGQYKFNRDPREKLFEFKKRSLVHFAVDTEQVFMTTRLAGSATTFLPFNQGCNGGAGNPPDPRGRSYRTAYLWEDVLARASILELFARFLHLQIEEKKTDDGRKARKETMVFPRFHQRECVRELAQSARSEGAGRNYLVENSAGSGKSNTIGWLAHQLSSLHSAGNERVFDCVVVVTDRQVLDRQLQDTIYQFEHRQGVVQKIDEDSKQLAAALESGAPIVITTLQKFPFVTRQLVKIAEERGEKSAGLLPARRYAVIIDEAHSSQSGEGAAELKGVLGGEALKQAASKKAQEDGLDDYEEEVLRVMARRGQQSNISFFAFTATPKHKTYAVFGRNGKPFHLYSMRQAIEEGFIMNVLKSYTSYATYFRLLKACEDDPNVERKKAAKALARFLRLHPHNIAQKTEVMIEHFNTSTRHKIAGKAKAMVVTGSRLEAVRYKQSFDKYIAEKGYGHIKTLVAFSGMVVDDKIPGVTHTEEQMNHGIREKELRDVFDTPEYQVLLVAEKYQTGFDQPLLHTMYVDKRLAGIQAVQTLSRLNRMHPLKEDTFVLDFVNDRTEIFEAFKQYYDGAEMGEEVEPSRLYEVRAKLDEAGIYHAHEVEAFSKVFYKPKEKQSPSDHQAMNAALDPAVERFKELQKANEDEAELFRGNLGAFRNLYSFLSQVIPFQDSDLEKLYSCLRFLSSKLPPRDGGPRYDFDDEVRLGYYRIQKISEGSIDLQGGEAKPVEGPQATGTGVLHDEDVPLSRLIDLVNERFGTDFTQADQLFFDQLIEAASREDTLKQAAGANPLDKFQLVFGKVLESLFIERMEQNEDIFARYMNEADFQRIVAQWLGEKVYSRLKEPVAIPAQPSATGVAAKSC